jgi:hypothetical protein
MIEISKSGKSAQLAQVTSLSSPLDFWSTLLLIKIIYEPAVTFYPGICIPRGSN